MLGRCEYPHDALAFAVSGVVCVGLVVSYLPQVVRILATGSSIGLSPWFLFLGATSSASPFPNVLTLQWGVVRCCPSMVRIVPYASRAYQAAFARLHGAHDGDPADVPAVVHVFGHVRAAPGERH